MKNGIVISTINKFGRIKQLCFGTLDNYVDIICGIIYKCAHMCKVEHNVSADCTINYMLSKINNFLIVIK